MIHQFMSTKVDIYSYPLIQPLSKDIKHITIGDLHANAIKLIYALLEKKIIHVEQDVYKRLSEIYFGDYKQDSINEFMFLINDYIEVVNQKILVRFLGDETSDRGVSDIYVLFLLFVLKQKGLSYEILVSNHGIEMLYFYTKTVVKYNPYRSNKDNFFSHTYVIKDLKMINSLEKLKYAIEQQWITMHQYQQWMLWAYLPNLKLLSYSFNDNEYTVYSHAPIDLEVIKDLCGHPLIAVDYQDLSPQQLATTVDKLNRKFRLLLKNTTALLKYVFDQEDMSRPDDGESVKSLNSPFSIVIWNRDYLRLDRIEKHSVGGYYLNYVHGHDSKDPFSKEANIFCLDNESGKYAKESGHLRWYKVLYSSDNAPSTSLAKSIQVLFEDFEEKIKQASNPLSKDVLLAQELSIKLRFYLFDPILDKNERYQKALEIIQVYLPSFSDFPWWKTILLKLTEALYSFLGMNSKELYEHQFFKSTFRESLLDLNDQVKLSYLMSL